MKRKGKISVRERKGSSGTSYITIIFLSTCSLAGAGSRWGCRRQTPDPGAHKEGQGYPPGLT